MRLKRKYAEGQAFIYRLLVRTDPGSSDPYRHGDSRVLQFQCVILMFLFCFCFHQKEARTYVVKQTSTKDIKQVITRDRISTPTFLRSQTADKKVLLPEPR